MEQLILNIKDSSKLSFLIQLIKQLDFVEIEKLKPNKANSRYNFFNSAGLWSHREIDSKDLRNKAWSRQK